MDEISLGSERDPRPPFRNRPRRWIIAAAAVVIALSTPTVIQAIRHHAEPKQNAAVPTAPASVLITATPASVAPGAASAQAEAAVGTAVVSCDSVSWWNVGDSWWQESVQAGPLWLLEARRLGYARPGYSDSSPKPGRQGQDWSMIVHIDDGSRVVMRAAAGTSGYFHFVDDTAGMDYPTASAVPGLTFAPCPEQSLPAGWIGLYQLTFYIAPGQAASVEVLTATSARPLWLTFRAPRLAPALASPACDDPRLE